jgi:hypothetical protein
MSRQQPCGTERPYPVAAIIVNELVNRVSVNVMQGIKATRNCGAKCGMVIAVTLREEA